MRFRLSCGIIPVAKNTNGSYSFLLVQGHGNYWGFPKGHSEGNETHHQTAMRELSEETGLVCDKIFPSPVFNERYRIPKKRGSDIIKKVVYFIGSISDTRVDLQTTELKRHAWLSYEDAIKKLMPNRIDMLSKAYEFIQKNN